MQHITRIFSQLVIGMLAIGMFVFGLIMTVLVMIGLAIASLFIKPQTHDTLKTKWQRNRRQNTSDNTEGNTLEGQYTVVKTPENSV